MWRENHAGIPAQAAPWRNADADAWALRRRAMLNPALDRLPKRNLCPAIFYPVVRIWAAERQFIRRERRKKKEKTVTMTKVNLTSLRRSCQVRKSRLVLGAPCGARAMGAERVRAPANQCPGTGIAPKAVSISGSWLNKG